MKKLISNGGFMCMIPLAGILMWGCRLLGPEDSSLAEFDTRVLEYLVDDDDDTEPNFILTMLKVYDGVSKLQTAETVNTYDAGGLKTKTEVFDFDPQTGVKDPLPAQYIEFTYDGNNNLINGTTYDSDGSLQLKFDVVYETKFAADNPISTITNYHYDGGWVKDSELIYTYYEDTDGVDATDPGVDEVYPAWDKKIRTEQTFFYKEGDATAYLKSETAYWYDPADGDKIAYILQHVARGGDDAEEGSGGDVSIPEGENDIYLYKSYSYNANGQIYLINDYRYDDDAVLSPTPDTIDPFPSSLMDPDLENPFNYSIQFDSILDQVNMVIYDYTDLEDPDLGADPGQLLIGKESHYTSGVLQEVRRYAYDGNKRLTGVSRYVAGGAILAEKEVTNYREFVYKDGLLDDDGNRVIESYIKETLNYSFE